MNHNEYIGKKLKELADDKCFCGGYYVVSGYCNSQAFKDDECLNRVIESITLGGDCAYYIKLK